MMNLRENTSDRRVFNEVNVKKCYRKQSIGFDVKPGEVWLDLGANFGAFAHYCHERGARAICYEAHPANFEALTANLEGTPSTAIHAAVTASRSEVVSLFESHLKDLSRPTVLPANRFTNAGTVPNLYWGELPKEVDGIKMDIEGAEAAILDEHRPFFCSKLVLEYHSSRDPNVGNFRRRLSHLKRHFSVVSYPPEFDRILSSGLDRFEKIVMEKGKPRTVQYPMADRLIFCIR